MKINFLKDIKPIYKTLAVVFIVLQLLFLGCLSYLYGSLHNSTSRTHNFNFLAVNLDDGVIADSLVAAYNQLKALTFPTIHFVPAEQFNSSIANIRHQVLNGNYWAAIITNTNASNNVIDAITLGGQVAQSYNPNNAITFIWDEVRYPPFSDAVIEGNIQTLIAATRISFNHLYGPTGLKNVNQTDNNSLQAFLNPIGSTDDNIEVMIQGPRLFDNTVSEAMIILQQFFLVLGANIMCMGAGCYKTMSWRKLGLIRLIYAILFTFFASLTISGYYWAFRENWVVNGNQFVLTWMVLWLLTMIHNLFLTSISCMIPMPLMPVILIIWIFFNITATITPFDMQPGFYHWAYALPGYESYQLLTDIWSRGAVPIVFRALPIMFAWLVLVSFSVFFAHRSICARVACGKALGPGFAPHPPPKPDNNNDIKPTSSSPLSTNQTEEEIIEAEVGNENRNRDQKSLA